MVFFAHIFLQYFALLSKPLSIGAGGLAILENNSLFYLGCIEEYHYWKICEGPVRAMFKLVYGGWHVNGKDLGAKEVISITPGKY